MTEAEKTSVSFVLFFYKEVPETKNDSALCYCPVKKSVFL